MFRQHSKSAVLAAVAILLFLGDFAVELLAPDVARIFERDPRLKRLLWGLLVFCACAAAMQFLREHNAPGGEAADTPPTRHEVERDLEIRRRMLGLVRRHWIEGVLHKSLWNEVRIILNLEGAPDAVSRPCDLALIRAGQAATAIPSGTPIIEIYRHELGELLLLGDPGSGKTTLLLEIAETLIREAEADPTQPIPVVFNLSAWRKQHTRLDEWLVEQLNQDYNIPPKIGNRWVENGDLLLLLDGLDEVAESRRAACVEAINVYRKDRQTVLRPMVICCRTREYSEIPNLRLNGAVVIQPLLQTQVEDYLRDGGEPLARLRAVLKDEPELYHELFQTPLMLQVAVMTYEGQSAADLRRTATPEGRRSRLWDAYIERMFARKQETHEKYPRAQALDWLGWLAQYLAGKELQKYLIEGMQPDDLSNRWQPFLVRCTPIVTAFGLAVALFASAIRMSAIWGIPAAIGIIIVSYGQTINLQPRRRLNWRNLRHQWLGVVCLSLAGATIFATLGILSQATTLSAGEGASEAIGHVGAGDADEAALEGVTDDDRDFAFGDAFGDAVGNFAAMMLAGAFGGAGGAAAGVAFAIVSAIFDEHVPETTAQPNEGLRHTARTAGAAAMIGGTIGALTGPAVGVAPGATCAAVLGAVVYGGRAVFQHYLLRLLLWRSDTFPRNITAFLDWATQRVLLQRVGGGWRFIHRSLQEHFAERYAETLGKPISCPSEASQPINEAPSACSAADQASPPPAAVPSYTTTEDPQPQPMDQPPSIPVADPQPTPAEPLRLRPEQWKRLEGALLDAFPTPGTLWRVVRYGLDKNHEEIAGGENYRDQVHALIEWAQANGRLADLVRAARKENPGNPLLRAVARELGVE